MPLTETGYKHSSNACRLDRRTCLAAVVSFSSMMQYNFMVILGILIMIISYIQSYSPGEAKKDARKISQDIGKHTCLPTRDGDSVLFLLVHLLSIGFTGAGLPLCVTSSFLISSPMVNSRKALLASCG